MASNSVLIHKLQVALNKKGYRIMYSTSQFYSEQQDRPVTMYHIKQAVWNEEKGKYVNVELFKHTSQVQVLLYMRDLWYTVNGKEVPQNNEVWNAKKAQYEENK